MFYRLLSWRGGRSCYGYHRLYSASSHGFSLARTGVVSLEMVVILCGRCPYMFLKLYIQARYLGGTTRKAGKLLKATIVQQSFIGNLSQHSLHSIEFCRSQQFPKKKKKKKKTERNLVFGVFLGVGDLFVARLCLQHLFVFFVGSWTLDNCRDPWEVWCSVILLHTYSVPWREFAKNLMEKVFQDLRGNIQRSTANHRFS